MNSEKVKEIKKALELNKYFAIEYFPKSGEPKIFTFTDLLTLINELESENEKLKQHKRELEGGQRDLIKRIDELEEGIAKSMLGCEFLPECTKEIAEKIWNMSKITVDATKHIVQGREYLHLDALKEIIKSCGVEIKE